MIPHYSDDWLTVYQGDCREVMASMEPESAQSVVTSPPYWGLRDYGIPPVAWPDGWSGSLGLEPTPELYVEHVVAVFREVRRVLRRDGTVWLNLGDSYAAGHGGSSTEGNGSTMRKAARHDGVPRQREGIDVGGWSSRDVSVRRVTPGLKPKDRVMIPARVALALQADGWWLRDEIVWAKPNPMPSSVQDRTTPAHEMVYLLTRSARYCYDAEAIRERAMWPDGPNAPDSIASPYGQGYSRRARRAHRQGVAPATAREASLIGSVSESTERQAVGLNARWSDSEANGTAPAGRNKRSVWTVATEPYPEAHFATFPEKLIEPMILAGCPEGGVVLDPFGGSGTVAVVAQRLGRRAVLIDLNADYLVQAMRRNQDIPLGLETA